MTITETVDAKKARLGPTEALELARGASRLYATKGKKLVVFDMSAATPTDAELLAVMLGPSGGLRAPTIRQGMTLAVGFTEELYRLVLAP